jgi:hypothetical protein
MIGRTAGGEIDPNPNGSSPGFSAGRSCVAPNHSTLDPVCPHNGYPRGAPSHFWAEEKSDLPLLEIPDQALRQEGIPADATGLVFWSSAGEPRCFRSSPWVGWVSKHDLADRERAVSA